MGNEASAEGEAAAGPDLSRLSEEERQQISAVMSRAQGLHRHGVRRHCWSGGAGDSTDCPRDPEVDAKLYPRQPGIPPDPGPGILSKSRTVDAFRTEAKAPGRSTSSMSLRTDFKEDQRQNMMPSFLTEGNPLSAVSSVVNKFNPFDLKSDSDSAQEEASKRQKTVQKEQEELKQSTNLPSQQQSFHKQTTQSEGHTAHSPQQIRPMKPTSQLQQQHPGKSAPQQTGVMKQAIQSTGHTGEQIKQSVQQPGSGKSHPQQSKPMHPILPHEAPAKPLPHPSDAEKPIVHHTDPRKPSLQAPVSAKLLPQQSGYATPSRQQPGPVKQTTQQPISSKSFVTSKQASQLIGPTKTSPQPQGPIKQPPQHPEPSKVQQSGPVKQQVQKGPSKQEQGPTKQLGQPPGHTHHSGPIKQSTVKSLPQHSPAKQPSPHLGTAEHLSGFTNLPVHQPSKAPFDQPGPGKHLHQQVGSLEPAAQTSDSVPEKKMCPLCKTTELLLHSLEKANYNTCTQCQITVCSQCGFNPNPHIQEIKEWLCLNCQMKRALAIDVTAVPGSASQPVQPKQKTVPASPPSKQVSQSQQPLQKKPDHTKPPEPQKTTSVTKQSSMVSSPPPKARQSLTDSQAQKLSKELKTEKSDQRQLKMVEDGLVQSNVEKHFIKEAPVSQTSVIKEGSQAVKVSSSVLPQSIDSERSDLAKPSQVILPDRHKDITSDPRSQQHISDQTDYKPLGSDLVKDTKAPKPIEPKSVKEDPKKVETKIHPKSEAKQVPKEPQTSVRLKPNLVQAQEPPKSKDQARRFSLNLGSMTETPKFQPTTPQETVTGKLFGFGASIFNQASSFISTATQGSSQSQGAQGSVNKQPPPSPSQPHVSKIPPKEVSQSASSSRTAPIKIETKPSAVEKSEPKADNMVTGKDTKPEQKPVPAKDSRPKDVSGRAELERKPSKADHRVTVKETKLEQKEAFSKGLKPQTVESKEISGPAELEKKPSKADSITTVKDTKLEQKEAFAKDSKPGMVESKVISGDLELPKIALTKKACPLCKTELNVGSKDPPNFNTCTECKNSVCNLCGFNPTPHLIEVKEWLCLNCQTERALAGQLGDMGKMLPPLPASSASPSKQSLAAQIQAVPREEPQTLMSPPLLLGSEEKLKDKQEPKKGSPQITAKKLSKTPSVDRTFSELKEMISKPTWDRKTATLVDTKPSEIEAQKREIIERKEHEEKSEAKEYIKKDPLKKEDLTIEISKILPKDDEKKHIEEIQLQSKLITKPEPEYIVREKTEKEDDKSDTSGSQQQKSPQGLSDTGYSSDGVSSSLGEIPSLIPSDEKELLKEPLKKESFSQESSPSSPSDLAKLESTVLSILEAQASADEKSGKSNDLYGIYVDQPQDQLRTKILPITPESYSSDEEDLEDIQEEDEETLDEEGQGSKLSHKICKKSIVSEGDLSSGRHYHDSLDDSSESENSPVPRRRRRASVGSSSSDEYKQDDSQGSGDDEDFIRNQIIEMSADEDASGSEDEEFIRTQLKEIGRTESQKREVKSKITTAKFKRLTKKSSTSYDDDAGRRHSWHDDDEETYDESPESKYRETKSQDSEELHVAGGGLRRFKTIELNSTITNKYSGGAEPPVGIIYFGEEPELEMESLTDSPEDKSRGEGSSSLHASSFTPGTSPTSVSSLDEDSDSSPSHKKMSGETKQQRKARHRSHGPVLPTIEDSSEEEELREEEELLKEQEKQRELEQQQQKKSASKKSKKDKDELRAQRRRERPKTPPSNLSPIEDASPTEELRQAAEMEELHRSSCSEYSPSIESEPEGFEISPEKIMEVQKVYRLPTGVPLYSPTEESIITDGSVQKVLKNADEAYDEMIKKAKAYQHEKDKEEIYEKEPLYGGMLIEDYIYESLVEDTYSEAIDTSLLTGQETSNEFVHLKGIGKETPHVVCLETMQQVSDINDEYYSVESLNSIVPQEDIVSSSFIVPESHEIIILDSVAASSGDEKTLLDADTAYEELMKRQGLQLTPGSSPTQISEFIQTSDVTVPSSVDLNMMEITSLATISSLPPFTSTKISIPDVKITQHFTANEDTEDEFISDYSREMWDSTCIDLTASVYDENTETATSVLYSDGSSFTPAISSVYETEIPQIVSTPVPILGSTTTTVTTVPEEMLFTRADSEEITLTSQTEAGITSKANDGSYVTSAPLERTKDHVIISFADVPQSSRVVETTGLEYISESTRTTTAGISIIPKVYDVASKELVTDITVISLADSVYDQTPIHTTSVHITEPSSTIAFPSGITVTEVLPTTSKVPSITSSAPFVSSKVLPYFKSSSVDSLKSSPLPPAPPPPPPPPPLPPAKPAPYLPKRPTAKIPVRTAPNLLSSAATAVNDVISLSKAQTTSAPPVPPKPSAIPAGLVFSHQPVDGGKPPIAPKPALPPFPVSLHKPADRQFKPMALSLNLMSGTECKLTSPTSPLSPHSSKSSPRLTKPSLETYVVITLPSEPGTPTDSMNSFNTTCWPLVSPLQEQFPPAVQSLFSEAPVTKPIAIESMAGQSMHTSSALKTVSTVPLVSQADFEREVTPSSVTQLITAGVTKTSTSLAKSKMPSIDLCSIPTLMTTETIEGKAKVKENGKIPLSSDATDRYALAKMDVKRTDKGRDLSMVHSAIPVDGKRQPALSDTPERQITTFQPAIVNLSTVSEPVALVTKTVTMMTCTTTMNYTMSSESIVDLGHTMKTPLQLTTSNHFQPSFQVTSNQAISADRDEVPINLSLGTPTHAVTWATTKPTPAYSVGITNGWTEAPVVQESGESGAVDLSTTRPHKTMVTVDETSARIVTDIMEDDDKPVDLTAGRRAVCCDMVYKLPFGRSCTSQQPTTTLPEDRFGYRDDHYQYDRSGQYGYRRIGSMKPSMSDTNLVEPGLFLYKSKNSFDYRIGVTDAAVDLTSSKVATGEVMDYSSKTTGPYPETRQVISGIGISAPQYSQARITPPIGSQYGVGSVLRSSNGVVYSSVATPIPTTFAITTQPGSIFSTTVRDLENLYPSATVSSISPLPTPLGFLTTVPAGMDDTTILDASLQNLAMEIVTTKEEDQVTVVTTDYEAFTEMDEDEAGFLIAPDDSKQQQLHLQRELLELEKLKQQRLAEELEWERQEIQRYREQETFMVQKKLEELHSMKQQLLLQQEEERQAQFMMRQETLAQQQIHLEQIQHLQQQLHQQLEEQKLHQIYQYSYDPSGNMPPQTTTNQVILEGQFTTAENNQFWTADDTTTATSVVPDIEMPQNQNWYTIPSDDVNQYISRPGMLSSVSEMSLKDIDVREERQLKKRSSMPRLRGQYDELDETIQEEARSFKKIVDSGVQTDDEDGAERSYTGRRRRTKKSVDTSVQTDDEDQDEWDIQTRTRRKSRVGKYSNGTMDVEKHKQSSKVSSIAVQTVAEISVQTEPVGTIRTPSVRAQLDAKIEIIKHISAPEKTFKGESLGCQTETDSDAQSPQYLTDTFSQKDKRRPTPLEIGYSSHLRADSSLQVAPAPPKSPKVLYSPISPITPSQVLESAFVPYEKNIVDDISPEKTLHGDILQAPPPSPKSVKMQRSMSDPKPLSPTAEDGTRTHFQYSECYMNKHSQGGTQKKVKRTLPNPPPEEATDSIQPAYGTVGSVSRRRICRTTTMARAKILQDIDRELDLVERESSKLRKKQAELDEEEKEIDAKLRYLEMGINRRKEALLKEREKRERAYLQGVAEERDYMSDSEVSSTRTSRIDGQLGFERPRTAPQTEFNQYLPPQTQAESQFAPPTSPYAQYQYPSPALPTQAPTQYPQQTHYSQTLYHQQVSPYQTQPSFQAVPTLSFTPQTQPQTTQQPSYQHSTQLMMIQQKPRQSALDLEPKITTNYEVIRNQPLLIAPVSSDSSYAVSHLSKYSNLDLRIGLDERSSMASSPMSSISAESYYADLEHHASRNFMLIDDIGDITKGSSALSSAYNLHDKDLTKADHLLRSTEIRRTQEVTDFLTPLHTSSRLHAYGKADEDSMEDPYELKLLKHQIKQEFRRGTENLDPLTGLSPYYHSDSIYRHFPKSEKYSISRLTLEKQAAKQLPPAILYQKQSKHKKPLIDPKLTKFSPIQENRDFESDYASYLSSSTSSIPGISSRARLLQDDITFGLRKNITDQQKYLAPSLAPGLGSSVGTTLSPTMRSTLQDEADKPFSSGSRSRPSSRPSSVYGLDLSIKRDLSSSSLRLKAQETESFDSSFTHGSPSSRAKPSSLPISQSRGRIPIVAQNSEEESPLSPVGQPMGMARAAAGPLPPISADTREQFGSSHSLPEVQQHMREESRSRGYDRDIAFIMDDFQHAMSDSEAYHLRREETDWFDKPREPRLENGHGIERRLPEKLPQGRSMQHQQDQINGKAVHYTFPHMRIRLHRDPKDRTVSGNGLGIRVVGGKEIPDIPGEIGAYISKILPGGAAEQTGKLIEGMQILEWNGIPLTAKTYEEVQSIINQPCGEVEICVRLDLSMLSDSETPQHLQLHSTAKAVEKTKSPGVDPKQLAAELQKVSLQQLPSVLSSSAEKGSHVHSGTTSAASSSVPSPGQPGSPSVSKKRHSSKPTEASKTPSHPITGEIQLQINYDKHLGNLIIHILQARNLVPRDNNGYSDPFVKVYLLPGRGQVMVVQNASAEYKRRTKHVQKSLNPEWNQTVIYKSISMEQLKKKTLEVTVWDYDRFSSNDFLGEVLLDLSNTSQLDNAPRWYPLKEQSDSIDHGKSHSGQSGQQPPKPSVIKSRSHGIFPDPSKDMQVPTIEKSHSSPGSSKSSSEGHLRSHGPSRSQSKTSVTQTHLEDAGAAIAAAEAAVQQLRLQPTRPTMHRAAESTVSTTSSASSFGSGYSMDSEGSSTMGDNAMFAVPKMGKMGQNGQEPVKQAGLGLTEVEGKTQMMGEIKVALKKEMKTDGEQLIVEILQCRNITYKFKSPDHLPDLYVKLYVINIASQKRVFKKKTRVCRHDREPSFNETFRFNVSPAGHSLQILLVSDGGKFMKKTLIGEAYIWLDKVDLRKRTVSWHKLLVTSTQTH
ncbi:protein piccolo [Microcaecilia unicolor]|uniref:Protein piccolo n=1 Tax=Microcaecilia unicolor TaxID=1415580 RepID=A0A6P7Z542_9AMPH|nr:protein piccolo [Microcaecilia unicolor]